MLIGEKNHMNADDYQILAMKSCAIPYSDPGAMLTHAVMGLNSEAGEVAGIFQKVYQGHDVDVEHVKKELGDCLWMIAEACTAMNFKMSDVMNANIDKLKHRYPKGFTVYDSTHRKEGDI